MLIDFWTYTCINSLRPLPYLKSWAAKYKEAGLVVIGVHTPEFSFEKDRKNVDVAVRGLNISFPVAIDSDYRVWDAFDNQYWPAQYVIDGKGPNSLSALWRGRIRRDGTHNPGSSDREWGKWTG